MLGIREEEDGRGDSLDNPPRLTEQPVLYIFAWANAMQTATLKPDRLFKALSDKTRLRILNLLRTGELCVCDLVSVLGVPQPKASRHLAYLRNVGLVTVRKESVWCYYQLAPASSDFEKSLWACLDCCGDLPKLAKDVERLKENRSNCCE